LFDGEIVDGDVPVELEKRAFSKGKGHDILEIAENVQHGTDCVLVRLQEMFGKGRPHVTDLVVSFSFKKIHQGGTTLVKI